MRCVVPFCLSWKQFLPCQTLCVKTRVLHSIVLAAASLDLQYFAVAYKGAVYLIVPWTGFLSFFPSLKGFVYSTSFFQKCISVVFPLMRFCLLTKKTRILLLRKLDFSGLLSPTSVPLLYPTTLFPFAFYHFPN